MDLGLIEVILALCVGVLGILQFRQKRALESERGERTEDKRRYESERAEDKHRYESERAAAKQSLILIEALREESRMGERMATAIDNLTTGNKVSADRLNDTLTNLGVIMAQNTEATNTVTRTLAKVNQTVSQTQDGVKELSVRIDTIYDNIMQALKDIADSHSSQSADTVEALKAIKNELVPMREAIDKLIPPDPKPPKAVQPDFQASLDKKKSA